jgi:hypothetical protein
LCAAGRAAAARFAKAPGGAVVAARGLLRAGQGAAVKAAVAAEAAVFGERLRHPATMTALCAILGRRKGG